MANFAIIFVVFMASCLVSVRADPLDPDSKDDPNGDNCIAMTDNRAQEVRQIIQELTDFIDNLALKHDYFDVKLIKLDIGKYNPENNDSSTGLDLIVDDCNKPSAYDFSGDFVADGDSDSQTSLDSATQVKKSKYQITHSSRNVTQQTIKEKTTQTVQKTTVDKTYNQYQNQNGYSQDGSNALNNYPANTDNNNNYHQTTDESQTADATINNNDYQSDNNARQQFEDNQYKNVVDQQNTGHYNNIVAQQNGGQTQQISGQTGQTQQYHDTTQYTETTNQIHTQNKQYVANTQNTSGNQQYLAQNNLENNISENSQEYIDQKTYRQSNDQISVSKQDNVTYQQNEQLDANDNNQIIRNNNNDQVSPNPRYHIETLLLQSLRQLIRSEVQQQFGKDSTNLNTGYDRNTNFDRENDNYSPNFVNYNRGNPNSGNIKSGYNSPGNGNDRNDDFGRVGGTYNKANLNYDYANTEINKYDNSDGFNGGSENYNDGNKFGRETNDHFNVYDNPNKFNDGFNGRPGNGNVRNAFGRGTNGNFNRYNNFDRINEAYDEQSDTDDVDYTGNVNTYSNTARINDGYNGNSDNYDKQTTQYNSVDDKIVRIKGYSTVNENQVVLYGNNNRDLSRPVIKRINLYNNIILQKKLAEAKKGQNGKSLPLIVHVLDTKGFRQVTIA